MTQDPENLKANTMAFEQVAMVAPTEFSLRSILDLYLRSVDDRAREMRRDLARLSAQVTSRDQMIVRSIDEHEAEVAVLRATIARLEETIVRLRGRGRKRDRNIAAILNPGAPYPTKNGITMISATEIKPRKPRKDKGMKRGPMKRRRK